MSKLSVLAFLLLCIVPLTGFAESKQPNILWIVAEDLSPWMGCYGNEVNKDHTPTIDKMAGRGLNESHRLFLNLSRVGPGVHISRPLRNAFFGL